MNNVEFDRQHIWHPYTSMKDPLPCYQVESADGVYIQLTSGERLIDGMASWWSVIHGYNHPLINDAIESQLKSFSHVMFGGLTHQPAIDLCKTLIDISPPSLTKVFLADSGSVAVEVALKMAIQAQLGRGFKNRNRFITIKNGYHGDTFGAMAVCDPENSMHSLYAGILPNNVFVDGPTSTPEQTYNGKEIVPLKVALEHYGHDIAALILEPVVQGAGGMRFYHPEYLADAKKLCRQYGVLLIADEIATGFGRTGKMFAVEHANIEPDILTVGKAITGGYMSLAATLCSDAVAQDISNCDAGVLMHGPTFMGNPLACSAANASLKLLLEQDWQSNIAQISKGLKDGLAPAKQQPNVADVRVFGAIGVIEMKQAVNQAEIQKAFISKGLWLRPFGKLIYVMPQYCISSSQLLALTTGMCEVIAELND